MLCKRAEGSWAVARFNSHRLFRPGELPCRASFFPVGDFIGLSFTTGNRDFPDFGTGDYLIFFPWIYLDLSAERVIP
jgi:hypothetical protein